MLLRSVLIAFLFSAFLHAEIVSKLWSRGYTVIPEPQEVQLKDADLRRGLHWTREQPWTDPETKELVSKALEKLALESRPQDPMI